MKNIAHTIPRWILAVLVLLGVVLAAGLWYYSGGSPNGSLAPAQFASLTIYDEDGLRWKGNDDELASIPHVDIGPTELRTIMLHCRYRGGITIWKTSVLGMARLRDGRRCLLAIDPHGGFFAIRGQRGCYICDGESQQALESILRKAAVEVFIPAEEPWRNPSRTRTSSPATMP